MYADYALSSEKGFGDTIFGTVARYAQLRAVFPPGKKWARGAALIRASKADPQKEGAPFLKSPRSNYWEYDRMYRILHVRH